jgi:hypothetical protein
MTKTPKVVAKRLETSCPVHGDILIEFSSLYFECNPVPYSDYSHVVVVLFNCPACGKIHEIDC